LWKIKHIFEKENRNSVRAEVLKYFWTTGHFLRGVSLADHWNIKRNILRILDETKIKFGIPT
jgi:hypothetical protein